LYYFCAVSISVLIDCKKTKKIYKSNFLVVKKFFEFTAIVLLAAIFLGLGLWQLDRARSLKEILNAPPPPVSAPVVEIVSTPRVVEAAAEKAPKVKKVKAPKVKAPQLEAPQALAAKKAAPAKKGAALPPALQKPAAPPPPP
jgi:hypothetical protein